MEQLTIDLENCYGIKKLRAKLDFSQSRAVAIYAPNGAMKTSLAETFRDVAHGKLTTDRIFPERITKREIRDESGNEIDPEKIVVIKSYEEVVPSEKTALLLVNSDLRTEYEGLLKGVQASKERLVTSLKSLSGSKDIEREISRAFTPSDDQFIKALDRVKGEVAKQEGAPFTSVPYDKVFDKRFLELLGTENFRNAIEAYVRSYNALIDKSQYFRRGVFNYYNASTIAKSLADNGFFKAQHALRLNGEETKEITEVKQLEAVIQAEKDAITNDPDLRKKYKEIEKALNKNQDLRSLQEYLSKNENILPRLAEIAEFREEVLKSYLKQCLSQVDELLQLVGETEERRRQIEEAARNEQTQWQAVISIFNDRFTVPFRLEVENLVQVILGQEKAPKLGFRFVDGDEQVEVVKEQLLATLSTGERKAFYILNILFDMQARMTSGEDALFIIDDIADSFDYKNKYAIIEYLKDAADHPFFRQIVLTHNFDFFRTACSRYVGRDSCLMAVKNEDGIELVEPYGVRTSVFGYWKDNFHQNATIKVATIPFIRNVVEYTLGQGSKQYQLLTEMLHIKPGTARLRVSDLDGVFNQVLSKNGAHQDPEKNLLEFIFETADECILAPEGVNFENKIALSIAIRLAAEKILIDRINDPEVTGALSGNQTSRLVDLYKVRFADDTEMHALLRQVLLMTPETIHLNSFMYEPIVDMADGHLRRLYERLRNRKLPRSVDTQ